MQPCCLSSDLGIVPPSISLRFVSPLCQRDVCDGYTETLKQNPHKSFSWLFGAFNNSVNDGLQEERRA